MDAVRWERIQTLFHRASELPHAERGTFVDAEAGDDVDLAGRVHRLLAADGDDGSLLDRPLGAVAERVLDAEPGSTQRFGPYRVVRLIGEGGMGVVYLAERDDLGSQAAVKVLRDAWISPARRERFAAEQRTLAHLNHPGIARLYDAGTLADGTPWIAMEHVDGVTLTEYCRAHRCTLAERLRLFRDVCDAVQHAHRLLVVHRDLKPSNILVAGAAPAEAGVKLLDFGIAKQLEPDTGGGDDGGGAHLTRTGMRPMTPAYAAPEQLRGAPVGVHTDVYALGVMLYELLAGRLPFDVTGRTPEEAAALILSQVAERPSAVARGAAGVPNASAAAWADLDVLCATAMHPDPQRRYATVEALARDVEHFLKGEPLDARPDGARYRLGKFARRHRGPLVAAAAVLAVVVGLVTFYTVRLADARDAAVAEAARTQRVQQFTLSLFKGGDDSQEPADSLRVVTLLDRGVEQTQELGNEPVVQADMLYTLGGVFVKLGRYDRADSLLRTSLDRRRTLLGTEHPDVAASLLALSQLREDQAKFPEAERLAREALAMLRRVRPPGHPDVPNAMTALGRVLQARAEFPQAIAVLEEAVQLQSASGATPRDVAMSLQTLSVAHFYAGHYATADSLQRVAVALDRRVYGDRHPQVASDLMDIGSVQFERANYVEAERAYREGMTIFESWYGREHPQVAAGLTLLAQSLIKLHRADEAVPLLERSLAIEQRMHPGPHPRVAGALNALGAAAAAGGRQAEAEQYYVRTADMLRALYGPGYYLVGTSLANQASTWLARGDLPRAERLFREALAIYAGKLPPDHMYVGVSHVKLGRTLTRQSRWRDAEPELLAGYAIVHKQAPTSEWAAWARDDLATVYTALGRPNEARKYHVAASDSAAR